MARRDAALSLLLDEQSREQERQKQRPQGIQGEDILSLVGAAAPVVGGIAGTALGGPAGAAIGGGVGTVAGMGANMIGDQMRKSREEEQMQKEEQAMRETARKRALASLL